MSTALMLTLVHSSYYRKTGNANGFGDSNIILLFPVTLKNMREYNAPFSELIIGIPTSNG